MAEYKVPEGNRVIEDRIGNARVYVSTDCLEGKTDADFQRIYDRTKQIYYESELAKALRERTKSA